MTRRRHALLVAGISIALLTGFLPVTGAIGELTGASSPALPTGGTGLTACEGRTPHRPVEISEDQGPEGFILGHNPATGEPIYRPGSGVVAGNGTAANPYVIAGWCISDETTPSDSSGIRIADTTAHVLVRDNLVCCGFFEGVDIFRVADGTVRVQGNVLVDNYQALEAIRSTDLEIANNTIAHNDATGVWLYRSPGAVLSNNAIRDSGGEYGTGVLVRRSPAARLADNTIAGNTRGVSVDHSGEVTFVGNTFSRNTGAGISFFESTDATVTANRFQEDGLYFHGWELDELRHDVDASNTVNGQPLRYVVDAEDVRISEPVGQLLIVNSTNVSVRDATLRRADVGLFSAAATNVSVASSDSSNNSLYGISLREGRDVTVADTTVAGNGIGGIDAEDVDNLTLTDDTVTRNALIGIDLDYGDRPRLRNNTVTENGAAASPYGGGVGISLGAVDQGLLANNTVADNEGTGIQLGDFALAGGFVVNASDNRLEDNVVTENEIGVLVAGEVFGTDVHGNNLHDNGAGIGLNATEAAGEVDATENWWGCADGPDDPACDDVLGNATYDPWLTSPNPDAGAS